MCGENFHEKAISFLLKLFKEDCNLKPQEKERL